MKLLHIGKFYPPYKGGMESYLFDLANEQVNQGHEVVVLVHNHQWNKLISETKVTHENGIKLIRQKTLKPILYAPLMLGLNRQVKKIIKEFKPDLIHLHAPNPSLFTLLFSSALKRVPWIMSWHSDMVTSNSSWIMKVIYQMIKPFENSLINNSLSLLVSSQYYADYSKQLKSNIEKVKVIPLGINTQLLIQNSVDNLQLSKYWQEEKFKLFNLGRLTFYKNHQMLINAMQQLHDCQLLIGGGGQLERRLNQQITEFNLSANVKLLGEISDQLAGKLYSSCDVFCLASHDRAESFGVVLLEAIYHDRIILVADTPGSGMKWLAENYNKGFTFKANDIDDFIKQLQAIKNNYEQIKAKPKQFDYDIESIAQLINTHYQSITK